jgi:uncharacterized membrane protein
MSFQDDLDAFYSRNSKAIATASEYARRAEKGIPSDRWADGTEGAALVARGIRAQEVIMSMLSEALGAMIAADRQRGIDAMEMHGKRSDAKSGV